MELFKLLGKIVVDNKEAKEKIGETTKESEGMSTKIQNACKTVGKAFTDVGKVLAPISAAAGAAFGFSAKNAIAFGDSMAKMSTLVDTSKYSVKDSLILRYHYRISSCHISPSVHPVGQ